MGVRILSGRADSKYASAMYDSVTGWMIGPIWEGFDAYDQIEQFLEWVRSYKFFNLTGEIGLHAEDLPNPTLDATDVRVWTDRGLEKLIAYWKRENLDEHGDLKETEHV